MAITLQAGTPAQAATTTSSATATITPGATIANGNTAVLVASVNDKNSSVSSVTGGGGTAWVKAKELGQTSGPTVSIWYSVCDGSGGTITVTWADKSGSKYCYVAGFAGVLTSGTMLDVTASTSSTGSTALDSGTTATTTNANDLAVGGVGINPAPGTFTAGPTNSFTNIGTPPTTAPSATGAYKIEVATEAASVQWTDTNSGRWTGAIITLFPAPAAFIAPAPRRVLQAVNRAATY